MAVKLIQDNAKIVLVKKIENPFRAGTEVAKRWEAVMRTANQKRTVAAALKAGARKSTVRYALNEKIIKVLPVRATAS
jgi:hypothetical protein